MRYIPCGTAADIWKAIKELKVRGAPAIGIAGAYGVYLGVRKTRAKDFKTFNNKIRETVKYLAGSRPTARNLFWGMERVSGVVEKNKDRSVAELKDIILKEAHAILKEDDNICRLIGKNGRKIIPKTARVLTHCNAGGLATAGHGTALGVIFASRKNIKKVYVDETRPVLQGARLTAWELVKRGIKATLICDNMAATLMANKEIDAVIVGADRIASNGDTANKIGTYGLAVLASFHKIPFYVAAPASTFDLSLRTGKGIPIEERDPSEVRRIGGKLITVKDIRVRNPAFDVTPAKLITAIITERGIITAPNRQKIAKVIEIKSIVDRP